MIAFTVYGVPVAKGRPRFTRKGFAYTPKKTSEAEFDFKMQSLKFKPPVPLDCPLKLTARFFFPIPDSMPKKFKAAAEGETMPHTKRPDLDNVFKLVADAMNGIFFKDDNLLADVRIEKRYSVRPRVEVCLEPIQAAPGPRSGYTVG